MLNLQGRELVATSEAYSKFLEIIKFIAGPTEMNRSKILFHENSSSDWKVKIIPNSPSPTFEKVSPKGRLKKHHLNIFGTGHHLKYTTLTANGSIYECLVDANVPNVSIVTIEPRSLIEQRWIKLKLRLEQVELNIDT